MKWNFKPLEVEEWIVEKLVQPRLTTVNENLLLNPFPYPNSGDPSLYKIILHWEYTLRTTDLKERYCYLRAEQEFIVKFDSVENNTEMMSNLIATSLMHLQQKFDERKEQIGATYLQMGSVDTLKSAKSLLSDLGRS